MFELVKLYIIIIVGARFFCDTVQFNPLIPTLKQQSNEQLYSNTVIGRLAVEEGPRRAGAPTSPLLAVYQM